jgi:hypothetical protein
MCAVGGWHAMTFGDAVKGPRRQSRAVRRQSKTAGGQVGEFINDRLES